LLDKETEMKKQKFTRSRKFTRPYTRRALVINGSAGAWSIPAWSKQQGISVPTFYCLPVRPKTVKIGPRLVRVIESPAEYNLRVAAFQQVEAQRAEAA
jgi:hypothetical protein